MSPADVVLACALELLRLSSDRIPRIQVLDQRPPGVSAHAAAFVNLSEGSIYLLASSPAFRDALAARPSRSRCNGLDALKMIAGIIVHEMWHLTHGPDEEGAYYAQLTELQRLGVGPGRWQYMEVSRALQSVRLARHRLPHTRDRGADAATAGGP
jgi:hypothetical protein